MVRIEEPDRDTYHHHYHNQGFDEDEAVQHAKVSAPKMNASWFGRPIEEVDHLVFDDTFCVISKKMSRHYIYRYSCSKSLFLLSPLNPIRKFAIFVTTHAWYDALMMAVLLANSITLAMITNDFEPGSKDIKVIPDTHYLVERIEVGFLGVYTVELILKVIAKGFLLNKHAYLRNRWNILDMIVVVSGFVSFVKDITPKAEHVHQEENENDLDFLRTFRVLRVVKTVSILPGLRLMINALLSSVVRILEVMALIVVSLMIFALFAVDVFQGTLRQKCVIDKGGPKDPASSINTKLEDIKDPDERDRLWTEWVSDWKNWKRRDFPQDEPIQCGNDSTTRQCGAGYTCIGKLGENPDDGWTSFDHFFAAMLSTFQLITADYWERVYDVVVSVVGIWSLFFFVIIIFVGSYYLLNLLLAVVTMSYQTESVLQDLSALSSEDRLRLFRRQSNFSFDDLSKLNICKMTYTKHRTKSELEQIVTNLTLGRRGSADDEGDKENLHGDDTLSIMDSFGDRLDFEDIGEVTKGKRAGSYGSVSGALPPAISNDRHGRNFFRSSGDMPAATKDGDEEEGEDGNTTDEFNSEVEVGVADVNAMYPPLAYKYRWPRYLKKHLRPVVTHKHFETTITICIILNTLVLALEHHGEDKNFEDILKFANAVFIAVFTLECILKLMGLQVDYFKSKWNIFDLIIVIISYVDLTLSQISNQGNSKGLSVIRSMRLLRVFKLARSWITMKVLLNIIYGSVKDLGNLTILLLIIIYIFAVMGMQVVGEQYSPGAFDADKYPLRFPRWNWKNFWYAFMIVFRVLCGEWIELLWECLQAQSFYIEHKQTNAYFAYFKCFSIFLPILIVGNFIVFNLFLAMLLNSFDTEELNAQREKEMEASGRTEKMQNIVTMLTTHAHDEEEDEDENEAHVSHVHVNQDPKATSSPSALQKAIDRRISHKLHESKAKKRWKKAFDRVLLHHRIEIAQRAISRMENNVKKKDLFMLTNRSVLKNPVSCAPSAMLVDMQEATPESTKRSDAASMEKDCFPPCLLKYCKKYCRFCRGGKRKAVLTESLWKKCRRASVIIVSHPAFEYTILFLIFASSILLCFEDVHLDKNPRLKYILCIVNMVFTVAFLIEMVLKWFAIGLWGYFTSFWTILDGFIVIVSLVSGYFDLTVGTCFGKAAASATNERKHNLGSLKALRTLRALRPLRAISRWKGMYIVVNSLIHAIPAIFNVMLVCLLFWFVFSIVGVQFFKGQFYRCVDDGGENLDPRIVPNKEACCAKADTHGYSWINTVSNFDNVLEGYLSLYQIATFEGWMELMSYAVDATGVDTQPSMDNQIGYYAFFVVFIIFGSFFCLELFTGVIIDNFNMLKKKYEGNILETQLTPTQRNYYITMKNLRRRKPEKLIKQPQSKFRRFFYYLGMSRKLEVFILIMIFLSMATESFDTFHSSKRRIHMLTACKSFFSTLFVTEALIKIIGLGFQYFMMPWNVFDFIVVFASVLDAYQLKDLSQNFPISPTQLRIVRVFRIGRILRTIKAAAGIRKLLFALTISLPALLNIGALLGLITFIYAILGMNLFGHAPEKWSIDSMFSFKTFMSSNLLLLRLMTLAGWNEVLDSLTPVEPVCGHYRHIECGLPGEPECPNRFLVVSYIVSYMLLTNQIMIRLFIAIILENYVEACDEENIGIVEDDLCMFYIHWSKYDPFAYQFIDFKDLPDFLDSLDAPFKLPKPNMLAIVSLNLPIARGNKIHCLDILYALIKRILGPVDDSAEFKKLKQKMERKFDQQFPNRGLLEIVSSTRRWKVEWNAASKIQKAWREYRALATKAKNWKSKTGKSNKPAPSKQVVVGGEKAVEKRKSKISLISTK